jgi:hypothetical protein
LNEIDAVVARAIGYAKHVIASNPRHYRAARGALEQMREHLVATDPDNSMRGRIEECLKDLDAWEKRTGSP